MKRIVFAGAGHASLIALDCLSQRKIGAALTLVSRNAHAHYSGMVPGFIEGVYGPGAMSVALAPFCDRAGVSFQTGEVTGLAGNTLIVDGAALPFDALILNLGAVATRPGPLGDPRVIPAKPFEALMAGLASADGGTRFAIIGGGAAGVEVALALATRGHAVSLIEKSDVLLRSFPKGFTERATRHLRSRGVTLHLGRHVTRVEDGAVRLDNAVAVPADKTLAFTGAAPPPVLDHLPLARTADGFLAVGDDFVTSRPDVLAVGDVATNAADPRPKAGVFAVRQGPHLARAVAAIAEGRPPPRVRLQRRGLVLLATGGRSAIGTRNGVTVEGRFVWRLKDRLDRAFVDRFLP